MPKNLTILLGAGFSAIVGMPTGAKIASYFDRDLKERLLCFSSSEWAWTDNKDAAALNNGKLNFDWLAYSYVLNELVKVYKNEKGSFINYEDFYQFIIDNLDNKSWITELFDKAKFELLKDKEYLKEDKGYNSNYLFPLEKQQFSKLNPILNYLIADLLYLNISDDDLLKTYSPFIEYLLKFDEVNIFTLNHDLFLERLFDLLEIEYSKGFNSDKTSIKADGKPLPIFKGIFDKDIRIYKLHGSLDLFKYEHHFQDGGMYQPDGGYDYFITTNYYEKHRAVRINLENEEVLQDHNFDIVPKFITGTNKTAIIKNDVMYKILFEKFESVISNTEEILISGYSFGDEHINEILKNNESLNFINHNRSKQYPFKGHGINIKSLDELQ